MSGIDAFEDHCWKDVVPAETLALYAPYRRDLYIGPQAALLAIDLYELAYEGGPRPPVEIMERHPSSCGIYAWNAIEPTKRLFTAARAAGLPVFYTTNDVRADAKPGGVNATLRRGAPVSDDAYRIRPEWAPQVGDVVVTKQRASGFYGTPLLAHLTLLRVDTLVVVGESTSGCVRATAVDAYSHGFHVVLVEECCFDRSELSHKVNLFDLHHKYADVMKLDQAIAALDGRRARSEP